MTEGGHRGRQALDAFRETARSANLRRAQLSFGAQYTAEWALTVAIGILAYRHGGATAVGVVGMVRMLPAALLSPVTAVAADRLRRERVLLAVGVVRAVSIGGAAATVAFVASPVPAYALAVVATLAQTLFRPAHSALLPSLCTTPVQLTGTNVVRGLLDSLSAFIGPLAAGALVAPLGIEGVLGAAAGAAAWSAWLIARVDYEAPPRIGSVAPGGRLREAVEGLALMRRVPQLGVVTFLGSLQTFVRGCFLVFTVVLALQLLHGGEAEVGVLTAAFGLGSILGSIAAALLVGGSAFGRWLGVGIALWGIPFVLLAGLPADVVVTFALIACLGVGNALVDVGGFTVMQRFAPDEGMARFFAGFESLLTLTMAVGSVAAPGLIALFGLRGALLATGLITPVAVALMWPRLKAMDSRLSFNDRLVALLQRVSFLRPLPLAAIVRLADRASGLSVARGTVVVEEGESADDVYVIGVGRASIASGEGRVAVQGPGDCFGEIAALGGARRMATVRAETELKMLRLHGCDVVAAVTGYSPSHAAADEMVRERLAATVEDPLAVAAAAEE